MTTPKTTGTTQPAKPRAAQPKKQPAKKQAAPKTPTATTVPAELSIDDVLAMVQQGGSAGSYSTLRSSLQQSVWNYDVYLGPSSPFRSDRRRVGRNMVGGNVRTKVKASELIQALGDRSKLTDAQYRALQEKLFLGGMYGTNNRKAIAWGNRYDEATREAYASALATNIVANETTTKTTRITLSDVLDEAAKYGPEATRDGGGGGPVFAYQPPDPQALKDAADELIPKYLGQRLSPAETAQLAAEFATKLESAARSKFDVEQNGGIATPAPDFESFTKQRARELHPDQFVATERANVAQTFLEAMNASTSTGLQEY